MTFATVGSRFQVVIPKEERKRLKLKPNTKVAIEVRNDHAPVCSDDGRSLHFSPCFRVTLSRGNRRGLSFLSLTHAGMHKILCVFSP